MEAQVTERIGLIAWLTERMENCRRIAEGKSGEDRDGWLEDASYFQQAIDLINIANLDYGGERTKDLVRRLLAHHAHFDSKTARDCGEAAEVIQRLSGELQQAVVRVYDLLRDVKALEDRLRCESQVKQEELSTLRKIAAHVPAMVYIKAKEAAGYGTAIKLMTNPMLPNEHSASKDCWCEPLEVEDGVWVHNYEH